MRVLLTAHMLTLDLTRFCVLSTTPVNTSPSKRELPIHYVNQTVDRINNPTPACMYMFFVFVCNFWRTSFAHGVPADRPNRYNTVSTRRFRHSFGDIDMGLTDMHLQT